MDASDVVKEVFAMLARRELAASTAAWRIARRAVAHAEGPARLALQEAITESLSALLTEIAEHGLQNRHLWGIEPNDVDVQAFSDECAAAWAEVRRLRASGVSSEPLIEPYVGQWMVPIGSREWLERMRMGVAYQQRTSWIERITRLVRGEDEQNDEPK